MVDSCNIKGGATYREHALLSCHREHGVVALGSTRSGVDEQVDRLVDHGDGRVLREHDLDLRRLEQLVVRVERQPAQLALDQIGAVLRRASLSRRALGV